MLVIGHRGNTLRILRWYLSMNTPVIEVDARYINNDFYAVHGPSSIKRASILGKIMAWIDYRFFYRDPLLKPLKLRRILEILNGRCDVMIDVKQFNVEEKLIDLLEDVGFKGRIYITSELHPVIKRIKEIKRDYITIASMNIYAVNMVKVVLDADADMVSIHLNLIDHRLVREFHDAGLKVLSWTINDLLTAEKMKNMGVDGLVTDRPDLLLKYFNKQLHRRY